jgi:hypothetical protein
LRLKGVSYDAGRVMGINWRPDFDPDIVRRELEIIGDDLHCNAVRICGRDIKRTITCAHLAIEEGLEVWLSPELWDRSPEATLQYITRAATEAEALQKRWPDRIALSVGSELTLFMQGIVEGRNFASRLSNPRLIPSVKAGEHNKPLNEFLIKANQAVRSVYHGKVTYASLVWEAVDWSLFDYVGVDHYRMGRIEDKYVEMLKPSLSHGKPVVITEFGYATTHGGLGEEGFLQSSGLGGGGNLIDAKSQFLHYKVPVFGRLFRPHLNGNHARDEKWQADKIVETLGILDHAGVEGAFVFQFVSQITPYSENPKHDLDMASSSLVAYYEGGRRHGKTYPDMAWEPKQSFSAVANYYATH